MGAKVSGLAHALYDPKKKQFLGRDGAAWGKLGVFYFFFYLGLAGFFCAMLAVFMALSPRDRPRYYSQESTMRTRSNPLSPGLGFRPQPNIERNIIEIQKNAAPGKVQDNPYVRNLNQYLNVYYSQEDRVQSKKNGEENEEDSDEKRSAQPRTDATNKSPRFKINTPGECQSSRNYGYATGRPCVLVKMNKIVSFVPKPGSQGDERKDLTRIGCANRSQSIVIHCTGENPADVDNIGPITYISENVESQRCGSLNLNRFPYLGKYDRQDEYQAPYVWVQFTNPKPNVLINVLCRAYAQNIFFDKRTGRGMTRFQLFVDTSPVKQAADL